MLNSVALVIPYKKNNKIDWLNLNFLINFQIYNKINLILLLGTTGESHNYELNDFINLIIFIKKYKVRFLFNITDINPKIIFLKMFILKIKQFFFFINFYTKIYITK